MTKERIRVIQRGNLELFFHEGATYPYELVWDSDPESSISMEANEYLSLMQIGREWENREDKKHFTGEY